MKTIFLTAIFSLCTLNIFAQFLSKEELAEITPFISKGAKVKYDEHEEMMWIQSKPVYISKATSLSSVEVKMLVYFGVTKVEGKIAVTSLHVVHDLNIPEWIFFNRVSFIYGTLEEKKAGTRQKFEMKVGETMREVKPNATVRERSDDTVDQTIVDFIWLLINEPKPVDIRYSGDEKYYEKYYGVFLKEFKKSLEPTMSSYNSLNQKYNQ